MVHEFGDEFFERVADLFREVFSAPPWNEPWTDDEVRAQLGALRAAGGFRGYVLVDDDVIGFALGVVRPGLLGREFTLWEMGIACDRQQRGLGTVLLRALEAELAREGIARVNVVTSPNLWPRHFYEVNGYAFSGEFPPNRVLVSRAL